MEVAVEESQTEREKLCSEDLGNVLERLFSAPDFRTGEMKNKSFKSKSSRENQSQSTFGVGVRWRECVRGVSSQ